MKMLQFTTPSQTLVAGHHEDEPVLINPRLVMSVRYDAITKRAHIEMKNGTCFTVLEKFQDVKKAIEESA